MTDDQGKTIGEIGRGMERLERAFEELTAEVRERHHIIANRVDSVVVPVSTLQLRMTSAENNLLRLDTEVKAVTRDANRIAGAGALMAILAGIIPWPWKP